MEFEPEQAEREIVILISELVAYNFLCEQFADPQDYHHDRLELRRSLYLKEVPALTNYMTQQAAELAHSGATLDNSVTLRLWTAASQLLPELATRLGQVRDRVCKALEIEAPPASSADSQARADVLAVDSPESA